MALLKDKKYYKDLANQAEKPHGLPANLLVNLLQAESAYNPDIISGKRKSSAGAIGIAQFMPTTAKEYNIDPTNPEQSIDAAAKYLKGSYKVFGNWEDSVRSYNAGIGAVKQWKAGKRGLPKETVDYANKIFGTNNIGEVSQQQNTNQAVENPHPEVPNISNGLTNFEGQYSLPTFVSNEEEPKKTKEEEAVEQKTNELNLLKDFYTGRTQIQPQEEQMIEESPQEIPSMDVMGEFNQISNFLEQAREGGFFEGWAFETMQQGGEIKTTPYGQWEFPNQITKVPSNNITMENVPRALMGIADTGEQRIMLPEEKNHIFEGATEVTEVPLTFSQLYRIKTGKELK